MYIVGSAGRQQVLEAMLVPPESLHSVMTNRPIVHWVKGSVAHHDFSGIMAYFFSCSFPYSVLIGAMLELAATLHAHAALWHQACDCNIQLGEYSMLCTLPLCKHPDSHTSSPVNRRAVKRKSRDKGRTTFNEPRACMQYCF